MGYRKSTMQIPGKPPRMVGRRQDLLLRTAIGSSLFGKSHMTAGMAVGYDGNRLPFVVDAVGQALPTKDDFRRAEKNLLKWPGQKSLDVMTFIWGEFNE